METLSEPKIASHIYKTVGFAISILLVGTLLYFFYLLSTGFIKRIERLSPNTEGQSAESGFPQSYRSLTFGDLINTSKPSTSQNARTNLDGSANKNTNNTPTKTSAKPTAITDTRSPIISESFLVRAESNKATISWSTDKTSTSQIEYGTTVNYGKNSPLDSKTVKDHTVELNELNVNTKYHFRMLSKDAASNQAMSKDYTFDTPPPPSGSGNNPAPPPVAPPPAPTPPPTSRVEPGVTKKVMVLVFNPIIESAGGKKLIEVKGWNDPANLDQTYINDIKTASEGYVNYQVAVSQEVDDIPLKLDGFKYTDQTYLDCLNNTAACHHPDEVDYLKILADYDICSKRNSGEIDELWLWGAPYFGYWEAVQAGPNAIYTNASPLTGSTCQKELNIMGFSYERGVSEMIEDLGHRTEGTMRSLYGGWAFGYGSPPTQPLSSLTNWDKFSAKDYDPGPPAGCGFIHGSLNTPTYNPSNYWGYDWENNNSVQSTCNDWLNFPNLTGQTETINCDAWGCDGYSFKKWWFAHLPRYEGKTDGKWNNWWRYVLDYEGSVN